MTEASVWKGSFVDSTNCDPLDPKACPPLERIELIQVDRKTFELNSSLTYIGDTRVKDLPVAARTVGPGTLPTTDLASVPAVLRWFVGRYGVHTPAALVHDRLIGSTSVPGVSDKDADSFFLDMLQAIGVRLLRRRLMWTAVTFGTRWRNPGWRRWLIVLWAIAGIAGIGAFFFGVTALAFGVLGPFQWLALAGIVPLPASALWGR